MKIKDMAYGKNQEASLAEGWMGEGPAQEGEQNIRHCKEFKSHAGRYH